MVDSPRRRRFWGLVAVAAGALAIAPACSSHERSSEPAETQRGRGTFVVMGQPLTVDYEREGDKLLFGGDIELDPETEIATAEDGLGQAQLPQLKNGSTLSGGLWPKATIPYVIHSSVTTPGRVRDAMDEWEAKTAIRFVKRSGQNAYLYVWESSSNTVCSAQVGHTGGKRNLNLRANGGCNLGVIVHELGHTIGFMHEHQRTDRDNYVKINLGCTSYTSAYSKLSSGVLKVGPYDIKSTMHYRSTTLNSCAYPKSAILGINGAYLLHDWATLSAGDIAATTKLYGAPTSDADSDGVEDAKDNCPNDANGGQVDTDGDGKGDACDGDDDADGVADADDNCPKVANANQADADQDGTGDACTSEQDQDGFADENDNCPSVANDDQADLDGDGQGDACDSDDDGDSVDDASDNCPELANTAQGDGDWDGIGDACDTDPSTPPDTPGNEAPEGEENEDEPTPSATEANGGCTTTGKPTHTPSWLAALAALLAWPRRRRTRVRTAA